MLYAVDRINLDRTLLEKIHIGVKILDTCTRDTYALEQAMDFITTHLTTLDSSAEYECPSSTPGEIVRCKFWLCAMTAN